MNKEPFKFRNIIIKSSLKGREKTIIPNAMLFWNDEDRILNIRCCVSESEGKPCSYSAYHCVVNKITFDEIIFYGLLEPYGLCEVVAEYRL